MHSEYGGWWWTTVRRRKCLQSMPMQEKREAREARVFSENKDWVTETKIRRPRPKGGVARDLLCHQRLFCRNEPTCDLLYRGGMSPTASHSTGCQ